MPKGPSLIDLNPRLPSLEEQRSFSLSARDRYGSLAVSIFDEQQRDQEIFKRQCFSFIKEGNLENLSQLITESKRNGKVFSLNFKDETTGNTPIILAAVSNFKKIAKLLLQQGIDITLRNNESKTALELASNDLRSLLVSDAAQIDLRHASWQGNIEAVKKMLNNNVDVNGKNDEGMTPLLLATRDINFFEKLRIIKNYHPLKVVRALLKNKADAAIDDSNGKNAFHHLVGNIGLTTKEILKVLLAKNVPKIDQCDSTELSPLHIACKQGNCEIVQIILNNGGNLAAKSRNGKTPLHFAVSFGHMQLSDLLIKHGADPTLVDASGNSAIDLAKKMKNKGLLKILEDRRSMPGVAREKKGDKKKKYSKVFFDGLDLVKNSSETRSPPTRSLEIDSIVSPIPIPNCSEEAPLRSPVRQSNVSDRVRFPALQSTKLEAVKSIPKSGKTHDSNIFFPKTIRTSKSRNWFKEGERDHSMSENEESSSKHCSDNVLPPESLSNTDFMAEPCSPSKLSSLDDVGQFQQSVSICPTRLAPIFPLYATPKGQPFLDPLSLVIEEKHSAQSGQLHDISTKKNGNASFKNPNNVRDSFEKFFSFEDVADDLAQGLSKTPESPFLKDKTKIVSNEIKKKSGKAIKKLRIVQEMENANETVKELIGDLLSAENNDTMLLNGNKNIPTRKSRMISSFCEEKLNIGRSSDVRQSLDDVFENSVENTQINFKKMKPNQGSVSEDFEVSITEKEKISKQNDEFLKKMTEGKVRDGLISTMVKQPESFDYEQKQKKSLEFKHGKKKIQGNCERTRKIMAANCIRIDVESVKKGYASRNVRRAEEKSKKGKLKSRKCNATKKLEKKKQLIHLSILPGFDNCLSDDAFRDMILGKSLDKHPRLDLFTKTPTESVKENKYISGNISSIAKEKISLSLNDNVLLNNGAPEEGSDNNEALNRDRDISSDVLQDEKYRSILDFYTNDTDQCKVKQISPEMRQNECDRASTDRGNRISSSAPKGSDHATLGLLTPGKADLDLGCDSNKDCDVAGFFSWQSCQEDMFKRMTEIAFAQGVGNSASSYRGSACFPSKEFGGQLATSHRMSVYESVKRSSISTQTSSDDSEFGDEDLHDWVKGNVLGKGAYGTVYLALTNRGRMVAVKQVEINRLPSKEAEKQYKKLQEEIHMLKYLTHKYIVKFIGTSMEDDVVNIFMEHIPGGSLALVLRRFGPLNEKVFKRYTRQIISGVAYLHENGIVHRDIKGANVMLSSGGVVKLIDFGCAKRLNLSLSQSSQSLNSCKGTPFWMAPEVIRGIGNNYKSDIWSTGCTVYEMATGRPPWYGSPCAAMYAIADFSTQIPDLPDNFSEESRDFVKSCLTRVPEDRPSAAELQKHRFIAKGSILSK